MPSTYTLNNGIELIATGEQSGTWGDTTNTNMSLLDTALDGQVTVTLASAGTSGSPNTLPISDGAASDGRNRLVIFNDGADLGATAYVQLTPNDAEKIVYIRNALSGSRSIIVFQGTYNASNDYEIPAGTTAVIFFNGGGTGAVAANVFNNAYFDSLRLGSVSVTAILDEDNMASDSATALATQQSIKAYVDSQVGTVDTLAEILANGNTTGGTDISVSSGDDITFADSSKAIFGAGSDLLIYHDGSNSYISEAGTGSLRIRSNQIRLEAPDSQNMVIVTEDAGVQAFYNGTERFTVTNTGIDVTGTAVTDGVTVDGSLTFQDDASFPTTGLVLNANTYLYQRGGSGGIIFSDASGTNEISRFTGASVIFNEDGRDTDFRVESDAASHMLFVDGGNNRVGIGQAAPDNPLHVTTSSAGDILTLESTNAGTGVGPSINLYRNSSSPAANDLGPALYWRGENSIGGQHTYANIYSQYTNVTDGTEACNLISQISVLGVPRSVLSLLASSTSVVINDESQDIDFRVESDSNTHAFFLDASTSNIGINTPSNLLDTSLQVYTATAAAITPLVKLQGNHSANDSTEGTSIDFVESGDGTAVGSRIIGTRAASGANMDLRFHTGRDDFAMIINQSQYIGMGTDDPLTPVHIKSTATGEMLRIESTDAGGTAAPILGLYRNSASPVAGDNLGQVLFYGEDSASNITTYAAIESETYGVTNGSESGRLHLKTMYNGALTSRFYMNHGETVANESSGNIDFRVESDSETHALFVDAGTSRVGINKSVPNRALDVHSGTASDITTFANDAGGYTFGYTSGLASWDIGASDSLRFRHGSTETVRFKTTESVFNELGADIDFRVESDNQTHIFFVDAGNDRIGIFDSAPEYPVHIKGQVGMENSSSKNFPAVTPTGFGYSQSTYGVVQIGKYVAGTATGAGTVSIGYDPSSNTDGGFTGYGQEMLFVNGMHLVTPNNADDDFIYQIRMNDNGVIINENSDSRVDFRVESDSNAELFFVDSGNNRIGMGTSSGTGSLHIKDVRNSGGADVSVVAQNTTANRITDFRILDESNNTTTKMSYDNGSNTAGINFSVPSQGNADVSFNGTDFIIVSNSSSADLKLKTSSTERVRFKASNGVVFNEDSNDYDFRIESNNDANMFTVDAGNDVVGIGTQAFGAAPTVSGGNFVHFNTSQYTVSSNSSQTVNMFTRSPDANVAATGTVFVAAENSGGSVQFGYIIDFYFSNGTLQTTARETGSSQGTVTCTVQENGAAMSVTVAYTSGIGGAIRFSAGGHAAICSY